jgi:benzodiazapine receptor
MEPVMPAFPDAGLRLPKPQQAAHGGLSKPLAAFAAGLAIACAAAAGSRFGPTPAHPATAAWYGRLRKPSYTPPGPVFGMAWTMLDALLCYSGYRLLCRPSRPDRNLALGFWAATVAGVGGFSYVLFGRKRLGEALGVTVGMVGTSAALVASAAPIDRKAAAAAAPLAAWVIFAFVLQEEVWRRN